MNTASKLPLIIAHRGLRFKSPENSRSAIDLALRSGIDGVEFDVAITADGVPILVHEETFRLSGKGCLVEAQAEEGRNFLSQTLWSELKEVDAGGWFSNSYQGTKLLQLRESLGLNWQGKAAYIELKEPNYWQQRDVAFEQKLLEAVYEDISNFVSGGSQAIVLSFNEHLLKQCSGCMPGIRRQWNIWLEWENRKDDVVTTALKYGFQSIGMPESFIVNDPSWVMSLHEKGLRCVSYPVSPGYGDEQRRHWTPQNREKSWQLLFESNVDELIVDYPVECQAYLQSKIR